MDERVKLNNIRGGSKAFQFNGRDKIICTLYKNSILSYDREKTNKPSMLSNALCKSKHLGFGWIFFRKDKH